MKIISLVILFITSSIIAQSHAEYYPLQVGNKWFYEVSNTDYSPVPTPPSISYFAKEVIGDTIMDNGNKYYVIHENGSIQYERYDTLTNEIRYYSMGSNPGNEASIYSLNYKNDSTIVWKSSYNPSITFHISFEQQTSSDTSFVNMYGDGLTMQFVSFEKYIGINNIRYSYDFGYSNSNLMGYRINGKEWGHLTGINVNKNITPEYRLEQNYPNPFNPVTTIEFAIAKSSWVKLNIYNSLGQLISTILDKQLSPGQHKVIFDASSYTSGIYFYQLITDIYKSTKKLILLK